MPEEVKQARLERFMLTQARISRARLRRKVGSVQQVLIDEVDDEAGIAIGRTRADAPEIDGVVRFAARGLSAGQMVQVRITASDEHDLEGELEQAGQDKRPAPRAAAKRSKAR